jgi:ATP-dependent helicase YprA (DUF1998 family)
MCYSQCKPQREQDNELIIDLMERNVADAVRWNSTDILITTPKMLYRILESKTDRREPITPEYMVIDEADLIINNR